MTSTQRPSEREALEAMNGGWQVPDVILSLASQLMRELKIPGPVTEDIVTFAIDIDPAENWFPPDFVPRVLADPGADASFCRGTATRLFRVLSEDPGGDWDYEYLLPLLGTEATDTVASRAVELARAIRVAARERRRDLYHIKYSNHEFVVVVRNGRADILQSFQRRFGCGRGLTMTQSMADGELERCLARMAAGGQLGRKAQERAFGCALALETASTFAFKKGRLVDDELLVPRLREQMRAGLAWYAAERG